MTQAIVTSVIKLTATQKKELQDILSKKYGVESIQEVINPDILGGLKVTIGSKQIDLSVRNKLDSLRK